jgi:hypothetical protein
MKTLKCVLVLFAFVGLMLVGCSDESQSPVGPSDQSIQSSASLQKNIIRSFTGKEGPDVLGFPPPSTLIDPGSLKIVDGNKMISRGMIEHTYFTATFPLDDPRPDLLSGKGILELNSNFDLTTGEGFCWGKLTVTPDNPLALGGVWEISWHGEMYPGSDPILGVVTICPLKWVGHGKGGAVNGMQLHGDDIIKYIDPFNWRGDGGQNCYIKEHK